jgi:hypothetical protein
MQMPRAGELLARVALEDVTDGCLPPGDMRDPPARDTVENGKLLVRCTKKMEKAATTFVRKHQVDLASCLQAVFTCVQTKPGSTPCMTKAGQTCAKAFDASAKHADQLRARLAPGCEGVEFGRLAAATGANLVALRDECEDLGVLALATPADYAECLLRQHACAAEELVRFEAPRGERLVEEVGRSLGSPFCPAAVD